MLYIEISCMSVYFLGISVVYHMFHLSLSCPQFHRDLYQKRTEINQPDSNGNNGKDPLVKDINVFVDTTHFLIHLCLSYKGLLGQHIAKKPKLMRQSQDNTFDSIPPSALSVPSPVGSQMSNMSNQNQFIRMLSGRDRGRKPKSLKVCMQIVNAFFLFHHFTS